MSTPGQGLTDLVRAARGGDREAFGELHRRFAPMVHGILLARVPVQEADDIVQDVFLHALGKLRGLREPEAIGPWLATIARNFSVRFHRRRRRTAPLPDDPVATPEAEGCESTAHEAAAALAAIRRLPQAYQETLILRLVEGLTGPQIAAGTGLTPGSVRVNLHRGMKLLRRELPEDRP